MELLDRIAKIGRHAKRVLESFGVEGEIDYICVFCRSNDEFIQFEPQAETIGTVLGKAPSATLLKLNEPITLPEGDVRYLKIRRYDITRPELGDADYIAKPSWEEILKATEGKPGFRLIKADSYKMIELHLTDGDARAYFSNPTLIEEYGA